MSDESLIHTKMTEQFMEFLINLRLQDKYITDSILKGNIGDAFIFICESILIKLVNLLGAEHRYLYDDVIENFVLNVYNIYNKSIYHKYDFTSENIIPIKQALVFLRCKTDFIKEHPEIISNNELLDFLCIKSSLILIQYIRFNIEGEPYKDLLQDTVKYLSNELQDPRFELVR
jgi:hypothetical protein